MTKLINGWYQDANGNKWNAVIYTKEQADKYSKTLTNCFKCINCLHCSNCIGCTGCSGCSYCTGCSRCTGCSYCTYCSDCSDCSNCIGCADCTGFKSNPQRITSPNIGSRYSQTTLYWNDEQEQVVCGCFRGTLYEFEERVKVKHGDNEHAKAYLDWIAKVKAYKA